MNLNMIVWDVKLILCQYVVNLVIMKYCGFGLLVLRKLVFNVGVLMVYEGGDLEFVLIDYVVE